MWLTNLLCLLLTIVAFPNPNKDNPLFSKYDQLENRFDDNNAMALYWRIVNQGQPTEAINGALVFNASEWNKNEISGTQTSDGNVTNVWYGIGFGKSMLTAEFFVNWCKPNSLPVSVEAATSGGFQPPTPVTNPIIVTKGLQRLYQDNAVIVEFSRPTTPKNGHNRDLDINKPTSLIWALNPNPDPRGKGGWLFFHGKNRGAMNLQFSNGQREATTDNEASLSAKKFHAAVMGTVWIVLFPASVFLARYLRFLPSWLLIHMTIQSVGSFGGVLVAAIYLIVTLPENFGGSSVFNLLFRPHSLLGLTITFFTMIQGLLGYLNRRTLMSEKIKVDRSRFVFVRTCHVYLGRILIPVAFVQAYLGLQVLFPWEETKFRGLVFWIAYIALSGFWLLLYIGAEIYIFLKVRRSGTKLKLVKGRLRKVSNDQLEGLLENYKNEETTETLQPYTWEDIGNAQLQGDLLVVAEGKYVYRINEWLNSHPGGRLIIQSVAGTDITQDYFYESGFDVESFVPKKKRASSSGKAAFNTLFESEQELSRKRQSISQIVRNRDSIPSNVECNIDEKEWAIILRARRTHVHSKLAIKRLSSFLCGELITKSVKDEDVLPFDRFEHRRYAIVAILPENPDPTDQSGTPVYRIKFSLLYPFDTRDGEPTSFLLGQSVKIQYYKNGQCYSNYYTPINGNLATFEVIVKCYPTGVVSKFLCDQRPGDRQFQINGPFDNPIINPDKYFPKLYDNVVCITGGTGIAIALKTLETLFLPTNVPLMVMQAYDATNFDEITLLVGQCVSVSVHFYDGWAFGKNLDTNVEGLFPLGVTLPQTNTRLTILNTCQTTSDICGKEMLSGSTVAYPKDVSIYHAITRERTTNRNTALGNIISERIDERLLVSLFQQSWDFSYGASQLVVVCGPPSLQSTISDILSVQLRIPKANIVLMPFKKVDGPYSLERK
ncbi:hypothetical protein HDV02_000896 [Globomyces sp. JEL0801]|nr:hypothetical protein HDV02_000896 [Globomyces sp. JEL0801]